MKLKCTFSQSNNFIAGNVYEHETVTRCGMVFNEVCGESGFPVTLSPGDMIHFVSAYSGYRLLADFQIVE